MRNIFRMQERRDEAARKLQAQLEDQIIQAQQVRNFFETDLGLYISSKIDSDIQNVKNNLVAIDAYDQKAVLGLQMEFKMLNRIKLYFAQALLAGQNAEQAVGLREPNED